MARRRWRARWPRLWRESAVSERQILAMAGHDDGIIAFGASVEDAGRVLMGFLARGLAPP